MSNRRTRRTRERAAYQYTKKNIKSEQRYTRTALWAETLKIKQLEEIAMTKLMKNYPVHVPWEDFGNYLGSRNFGAPKKKAIPKEWLADQNAGNTDMEAVLYVLYQKLMNRRPRWVFKLIDKIFNKPRYNYLKHN